MFCSSRMIFSHCGFKFTCFFLCFFLWYPLPTSLYWEKKIYLTNSKRQWSNPSSNSPKILPATKTNKEGTVTDYYIVHAYLVKSCLFISIVNEVSTHFLPRIFLHVYTSIEWVRLHMRLDNLRYFRNQDLSESHGIHVLAFIFLLSSLFVC